MEDLSVIEKTQIVNDLVGAWLDEYNMFLLAKEGELVYWTSITGEAADLKWHKLSVIEASRVAKVMVVPPQYMTYCTSDSIYTAAQERGRAYMEGVRSRKPVTSLYFNFLEHEGELYNPYFHTTLTAVKWFADQQVNVEWQLLKSIIRSAWENLSMDVLTDVEFNNYIREAARECNYDCKEFATRYWWEGKQRTCLKLPNIKGLVYELDTEEQDNIIRLIEEKHNGRNKLNGSKPRSY